jgi:hypothetical protein
LRLTIRWVRRRQDEAGVLLNVGLLFSDRGLMPRALRDIKAANQIGRFHVANHELAVTLTLGTHLALTQLLRDQPERDADQAADQLAEDLLRLFGLSAEEAREICRRPLPELDDLTESGAPDQRTETLAAMPADDNGLAMSGQ